jgi:hypothetical protein
METHKGNKFPCICGREFTRVDNLEIHHIWCLPTRSASDSSTSSSVGGGADLLAGRDMMSPLACLLSTDSLQAV